MRFIRDAIITIVLLGTAAAVSAVAIVRNGGLSASDEPNRLERSVAEQLVQWSIPQAAEQQQNPFATDDAAWRDAREHYLDHCAACHGSNGRGQTEFGANMYPPVPDLASAKVQARTDGALYYIIQNGVRWTGMPAWKTEHSTDDTWRLVAFIRRVPTLTDADMLIDTPRPDGPEDSSRQESQPPHRHDR